MFSFCTGFSRSLYFVLNDLIAVAHQAFPLDLAQPDNLERLRTTERLMVATTTTFVIVIVPYGHKCHNEQPSPHLQCVPDGTYQKTYVHYGTVEAVEVPAKCKNELAKKMLALNLFTGYYLLLLSRVDFVHVLNVCGIWHVACGLMWPKFQVTCIPKCEYHHHHPTHTTRKH